MRPQFERVGIPHDQSIRVFHRRIEAIPFEWHHHPEYELTLTLNSRGWRFIGDHIGAYGHRDLVLVPSEMPHTWASTAAIDPRRPHTAIVIWFPSEWAAEVSHACPEFASLRKLLKRAPGALNFSTAASARAEESIADLLSASPRVRVTAVLNLLAELADADAVPLAAAGKPAPQPAVTEAGQLNRVLHLLHQRYSEPIRLKDLCTAANLSERSLHRLFLRHVGENVSSYLGRLRIGRACLSLVETDRPVSLIAAEVGFTNLANFNRRFREARHMTPREFRRFVAEHGRMPQEHSPEDLTKRSPSLELPQPRQSGAIKRSTKGTAASARRG